MNVQLLAGRPLSEADSAKAPLVAVINETMAKRFWPGENPIGHRIKWGQLKGDSPWMAIVGIVADTRRTGYDGVIRPRSVSSARAVRRRGDDRCRSHDRRSCLSRTGTQGGREITRRAGRRSACAAARERRVRDDLAASSQYDPARRVCGGRNGARARGTVRRDVVFRAAAQAGAWGPVGSGGHRIGRSDAAGP